MDRSAEAPLLEIQERLIADTSGEARREIESAFAALHAEARRLMAAGAAPAEYRGLEAVADAAEAAQAVVDAVWRRHHGGS